MYGRAYYLLRKKWKNMYAIYPHKINSFKDFPQIKKTILVYNKKHKKSLNKLNLKKIIKISGGKTRQESVFNALKKIKKMNCKKVLIHDAARPYPSKKLINNLLKKLDKNDAVIPIIKTNDATKRSKKNIIFKNIKRDSLSFAQTPQGFDFKKIYTKHQENKNLFFDDDSSLFTEYDEKVLTIISYLKVGLRITSCCKSSSKRIFLRNY